MSVCRPAAMAGQPCAWGAVGASNEDPNQARVGAAIPSSGSTDEFGADLGERGTGPTSLAGSTENRTSDPSRPHGRRPTPDGLTQPRPSSDRPWSTARSSVARFRAPKPSGSAGAVPG